METQRDIASRLLSDDGAENIFTHVEKILLAGIQRNKTYVEIAQESNYSPGYLTNVAGPKLLRKISVLLGRKITKKNCKVLLENSEPESSLQKFRLSIVITVTINKDESA